MAVYTGSTVSALSAVAQNDNYFGQSSSSVRFRAVAGTTYFIAIDGRLPEASTGSVSLQWSLAIGRTIYLSPGGRATGTGNLTDPISDVSLAFQSVVQANDEVVFRGGTYNLTVPVNVNKPGLWLSNYAGEAPVLSAPYENDAVMPSLLVITASQVTIAGLGIRGGSYYSVKIDLDAAGQPTEDVTLRNCRVGYSGRDCIKTFDADKLLVENCDIGPSGVRDPSNAEGIDSIGSHGVTVRSCNVHDTATTGIYFKGGATDGLVEGCKVTNAGAHGVLLGQSTDLEFMRDNATFEAQRCTARGNTITNAYASGLGTYSGANILFENNSLINVGSGTGSGFYVSINGRSIPASNVTFRNNTVEMWSGRAFVNLIKMEESAGVPAIVAQNNLYLAKGSLIARPFVIERDALSGGWQNFSFDGWKSATRTDSDSTVGLTASTA